MRIGNWKALCAAMAATILWLGGFATALRAQPAPTPAGTVVMGINNVAADGKRSIGASGHAVFCERADNVAFVQAVEMFAGRYGTPEPPNENFHLYLLNEQGQVLADLPFPYSMVERADLRWYTLAIPAVEVPKKFFVALAFNPGPTKGIYLGYINGASQSHSFTGLPDSGYERVKDNYDWMIRIHMSGDATNPLGVRRLADWKSPQKSDPFAGCTELKYDNGLSEGQQSYGGRGPAIRFTIANVTPAVKIKGFRFYGSRYGSGFDPNTATIKVSLAGSDGKVVWQERFPYSLMGYKANWVDLVPAAPIAVAGLPQGPLTLAFDPEAQQTKGIYFHYNKNPQVSHSLAGTVERGFKETPDREWMIRVFLSAD